MQYALIDTDKIDTVRRYMPSNYSAEPLGIFVLVYGHDYAGYTLEDYVLPRMAQWGLCLVRKDRAYVEYLDGIFSLIDAEDPLGMPVEEFMLYETED